MEGRETDPWYAIRVKANCERTATVLLTAKGFQYSLPLFCKQRKRWSDRYKTVEMPLFPGYIFCRFDLSQRAMVLATRGVLHVVSCGGVPVPVDPIEIVAVQAIAESGFPAEPWPYLEAGQRVEMVDGPLAGVSGMVCEQRSRHRLVVNVTLLRRAVSVEVDADWVRPVAEGVRPAKASGRALALDNGGEARSFGAVPA
jgi:transcription antitermination factor NusG